jgi:predicted ATPase
MESFGAGVVTGRYGFVHALYQQVLYERLAAVRRIHLHRRIGEWGEGMYGGRGSEGAAELAMHFERGQEYGRAVEYLTQAADNAMGRHAYQEAIRLWSRALELLQFLPETVERAQQELTLQISLGAPLTATKGYAAPEVERVYARAQELGWQVGESPQLSRVLLGLFTFYLVRAKHQTARELGEQILHLAQSAHNSAHLLGAHQSLGTALFHLGEFDSARDHLERGMALYDPQKHRSRAMQNPGVASLSYMAWSLWMLGYPEQALRRSHEALTLAQELSHPFSLAWALNYTTGLRQFRREAQMAQERAEALIALSSEQMFAQWLPGGMIMRGWALAKQGQGNEGIAQIRQGLTAWRTTGAGIGWPWFLAMLAEAYGEIGQAQEGLTLLVEALATVNITEECMYEAELYRLKGELTLQKFQVSGSQLQVQTSQKLKVKSRKSSIPNTQPPSRG